MKQEQIANIENSGKVYVDRIWELTEKSKDKYEVGRVAPVGRKSIPEYARLGLGNKRRLETGIR